jgi:hypothetical protein
MELVGWLWCGLLLLLLAIVLWWHELLPASKVQSRISANRVDLWSFSHLVDLHTTGGLSQISSDKSPRWRKEEEVAKTRSLNKCVRCFSSRADAVDILSTRRGGEGEEGYCLM